MSHPDDPVFKALADPTRRMMLDKLFATPGLTVGDLVANTGMRRQSASKHLKLLEQAGLVHVEWEGREKRHFLNPVPIREIALRWVDKFNQVQADALIAMKQALEDPDQKNSEPEQAMDSLPEEGIKSPQGPIVTSFFTPIED